MNDATATTISSTMGLSSCTSERITTIASSRPTSICCMSNTYIHTYIHAMWNIATYLQDTIVEVHQILCIWALLKPCPKLSFIPKARNDVSLSSAKGRPNTCPKHSNGRFFLTKICNIKETFGYNTCTRKTPSLSSPCMTTWLPSVKNRGYVWAPVRSMGITAVRSSRYHTPSSNW